MTVRKGIYWALQIIAIALALKFALWAYQDYMAGEEGQQQLKLLDIDKICKIVADTGQCNCRHRRTNETLNLAHEECLSRARTP